jgi:hypothetical protein
MKFVILSIASISCVSCFPSSYLERPEVNVKVIDSKSLQKITGGRVTYKEINPWANSPSGLSGSGGSVFPANEGVAMIPEKTSFGMFWLMQQPVLLNYSLTAEAPGYRSSTIKRKLITHGPFRPNQESYSAETIKLLRR